MNRTYHKEKDLKNTYLWIDREGLMGEVYEEHLLHRQMIPELIPLYTTEDNGKCGNMYILDHRVSFLEWIQDTRINCEHMESLLRSLFRMLNVIDEYLLDPANVILEMDFIFCEEGKCFFVYLPGYQTDFWKQLERLSEAWLSHVNYENEKAVLWAYEFYRKVHEKDCSMEHLLDILQLESKPFESKTVERIQEEPSVYGEEVPPKNDEVFEPEKKEFSFLKRILKKRKKKEDDFFSLSGDRMVDDCTRLLNSEHLQTHIALIPMGDNTMSVIHIHKKTTLMGRAEREVDVSLLDRKISRIHARIEMGKRKLKIVDLNSANGTFLNGERLESGKEYDFTHGDQICFAHLEFLCQIY